MICSTQKIHVAPGRHEFSGLNNIHLLPSLEGDTKICPTQKIHVARGRHEFSGWDKSSCLPTNWAINCLLYRKL